MSRVFISHSSKDKDAVEKLARDLAARGIETWLDLWEIGTGDDFVARINDGLAKTGAALIIFSQHSGKSVWVRAEISYLIYAKIEENRTIIHRGR